MVLEFQVHITEFFLLPTSTPDNQSQTAEAMHKPLNSLLLSSLLYPTKTHNNVNPTFKEGKLMCTEPESHARHSFPLGHLNCSLEQPSEEEITQRRKLRLREVT